MRTWTRISAGALAIVTCLCVLAIAPGCGDKPATTHKPKKVERAEVLGALSKEVGGEVIDLHGIDADDKWAYQINDQVGEKKAFMTVQVSDVSRAKTGYYIHGTVFFADITRTWQVRLRADEQVIKALPAKRFFLTVQVIIDQAHFAVFDGVVSGELDEPVTENETPPVVVQIGEESALLITGRVLAIHKPSADATTVEK